MRDLETRLFIARLLLIASSITTVMLFSIARTGQVRGAVGFAILIINFAFLVVSAVFYIWEHAAVKVRRENPNPDLRIIEAVRNEPLQTVPVDISIEQEQFIKLLPEGEVSIVLPMGPHTATLKEGDGVFFHHQDDYGQRILRHIAKRELILHGSVHELKLTLSSTH